MDNLKKKPKERLTNSNRSTMGYTSLSYKTQEKYYFSFLNSLEPPFHMIDWGGGDPRLFRLPKYFSRFL